jgi:hypothetical protein
MQVLSVSSEPKTRHVHVAKGFPYKFGSLFVCGGGGLYFFFIIISFFVLFAAEGDEFYKAVYHKEHVYCKSTMAWSNHSYSQR